jgi:hypothetical protein
MREGCKTPTQRNTYLATLLRLTNVSVLCDISVDLPRTERPILFCEMGMKRMAEVESPRNTVFVESSDFVLRPLTILFPRLHSLNGSAPRP